MSSNRKGRKTKYPGLWDLGNGQYHLRLTRVDPGTGLKKWKERVIAAKSVDEALQARMRLQAELEGRAPVSGGAVSRPSKLLGAIATEWLRQKVEARRPESKGGGTRLAPTTIERYTNSVEQVIVTTIGTRPLSSLTRRDVEGWRDTLAEHYATATVNGHLRVLRQIFAFADQPQLGTVQGLDEDDTRITEDAPNMLTSAELSRFLDAARRVEPSHYALILLLFTTGARISTALALERQDFDPEQGIVVARRRRSGLEVIEGVKRRRTARDVLPLLPVVWEEIRSDWEVHNDLERASGLAFPGRAGGYRSRSVLNHPLQRIAAAAGITARFTPHGCRRTCVDLLTRAAGDRVAMSVAGHLTTEMNRHYSRVDDAEKIAGSVAAFGNLRLVSGKVGGSIGGPLPEAERPVGAATPTGRIY